MRASLLAAVCLGLTAAACGSGATHTSPRAGPGPGPGRTTATSQSSSSGAGSSSPGARHSFQGSVSSASGAYSGEGGRAAVSLDIRGSGVSRPIKLAFRSLPCQGAPQCVELDGTLVGVIAARARGVPDTGRSYDIAATGRLTTLGHVTARGIGQGTGFIARGHELLDLTLTSSSGRVTLRAVSGSVGAFSSP